MCLIEADRDREKVRMTYSDFKEVALPFARALQDAEFKSADRAAIIMTNQSKWLISAYAIFYCGGVLVPLDYKLTPAEHLQLLMHSKAQVFDCRVPYLARHHADRWISKIATKKVLVTEAPPSADLGGAFRWEDFKRKGASNLRDAASGKTRLASFIPQAQAGALRDAYSRTKTIWSSANR